MNRTGRAVIGWAAILAMAWACRSETLSPRGRVGSSGMDGSGGGGLAGSAGASNTPGEPPRDAGLGASSNAPGADASVSNIAERRVCGFDGHQFSTYHFPTGQLLHSLNIEEFRAFTDPVAVDGAGGELFVQICTGNLPPAGSSTPQRSCSISVFSAQSTDFDPPLRSISSAPNREVAAIALDSANDNLIALVFERDAARDIVSRTIVTLARNAIDLSAPIREFRESANQAERLQFDAVRGELYVFGGEEGAIRIYPRDASGSATPLRTMSFFFQFLLSPLRGEYHVLESGTLETYALPAPAAPGTLPLRTLTGLPNPVDPPLIDEERGELWLPTYDGVMVFDLTSSGEAVSLRTFEYAIGVPLGIFEDRDEIVVRRGQGDLAIYPRTTLAGTPLRVIEGTAWRSSPAENLLGIDAQRGEVFFLSGDRYGFASGIVTVYPLAATGDAAPLRRLSTSLRFGSGLLDAASGELLEPGNGEVAVYPAAGNGQVTASRRFSIDVPPFADGRSLDFSLGVVDAMRDQFLGVMWADGHSVVDDPEWRAHYAAYSLSGGAPNPVTAVASPRGPPLHWVTDDSTEGRLVSVSDLAYDVTRDEVVLAVKDCFLEEGGPGAAYTADYSDCHHELRSYPRLGGRTYEALELPEEIRALDYDTENDMLMVSGQTNLFFIERADQGAGVLGDAGAVPNGALPSAQATYQFPLTGTFQYCD